MKKYLFLTLGLLAITQSAHAMNWKNIGRAAQKACSDVGRACEDFLDVVNTELGRAIASQDAEEVRRLINDGRQVTDQYIRYARSIKAIEIVVLLEEEAQ